MIQRMGKKDPKPIRRSKCAGDTVCIWKVRDQISMKSPRVQTYVTREELFDLQFCK